MKKTLITFVLILVVFTSYGQEKTQESNVQEKNKQEQKKDNGTLNKDEALQYKQDLLELTNEVVNAKNEFEEKRTNLFTKYFELWAFIGVLLGFFGLKKFTIEEIKSKVSDTISQFTKIEKEYIKKNLKEFKKHSDLKKDSKILLLNQKGTKYPDSFIKVLDLFEIDYKGDDLLEVTNLKDLCQEKNIERMKQYDLVLIENQISTTEWFIQQKRLIEKDHLSEEEKNINQRIAEGNKLVTENKKALIDLANNICDTTAILYYAEAGTGFFPTKEVKEKYQHMITFANAPSQLYGNMLNMLKFKNELENA